MKAVFVLSFALLITACLGLTAADKIAIAKDAVTIAGCQEEGRACKADGGKACYGVYDDCITDGGLR